MWGHPHEDDKNKFWRPHFTNQQTEITLPVNLPLPNLPYKARGIRASYNTKAVWIDGPDDNKTWSNEYQEKHRFKLVKLYYKKSISLMKINSSDGTWRVGGPNVSISAAGVWIKYDFSFMQRPFTSNLRLGIANIRPRLKTKNSKAKDVYKTSCKVVQIGRRDFAAKVFVFKFKYWLLVGDKNLGRKESKAVLLDWTTCYRWSFFTNLTFCPILGYS